MNLKRLLLIISFSLLYHVASNAQINRLAANIGYQYFHISSGYLGADYRLNQNTLNNNHGPLTVGVGTYLHKENDKFGITPEIHLNKTWKHFLTTELSCSPKNIKPSIGLSFFNLSRFQFGYSIPIDNSNLKGFYFGFHILLGRSQFYDEIRVY